jgi:hypothetical protein
MGRLVVTPLVAMAGLHFGEVEVAVGMRLPETERPVRLTVQVEAGLSEVRLTVPARVKQE